MKEPENKQELARLRLLAQNKLAATERLLRMIEHINRDTVVSVEIGVRNELI